MMKSAIIVKLDKAWILSRMMSAFIPASRGPPNDRF
jgi:hypothetical protein